MLSRGTDTMIFDLMIKIPKGVIYCMVLKRTPVIEVGAATMNLMKKLPPPENPKAVINIDAAHAMFGHYDEPSTRQCAYARGYGISRGTLKPCGYCDMAKARQREVPKISGGVPATKPNERMGLDITSVKVPNDIMATVTEPHWRIIVDELTGMKFSNFYKTKNQMVEQTAERFYSWKANGIPVKHLRMDNAGENKALQARVNSVD